MADQEHFDLAQILAKFWTHIVTALTGLAILFRKKLMELAKQAVKSLLKDHQAALDAHEVRDVERFGEVKDTINQLRGDILDAIRDNYKNIREDRTEDNKRIDKRLEFLEKVFLDARLKVKDERDS